mmetsp:Transcript_49367/g.139799  ORF Transcript_49367/g.139799 Transcript_49367/m.139799 type:complete len:203 (+) Transcript_49367:316-924(+)
MADSLAFTAIDELSIQKLNDTHETDAVKSMLSEAIGVAGDDDLDEAQKEVAIDFYFYCFAFCKECGFDTLKTSTFLSIAKQTCNFIRLDASTDMNTAFEKFKALMFAHAVERSPHAVLIFSVEDVEKVTEFMLNSYFRHFKLYKYIFTAKEQVTLVQEVSTTFVQPSYHHRATFSTIFLPLPYHFIPMTVPTTVPTIVMTTR